MFEYILKNLVLLEVLDNRRQVFKL